MPGRRLQRLIAALKGSSLDYIEQADGSRYYFNPESPELFLFGLNSVKRHYHGEPLDDPPELLRAIANAKDRREALRRVFGDVTVSTLPYELEPLVDRGELVERSLVAGHPLAQGPLEDRSLECAVPEMEHDDG